MPRPSESGFLAPFVKALENKKGSQIALRLHGYFILLKTAQGRSKTPVPGTGPYIFCRKGDWVD
jgi:hypothetical protein